MVLLALICYTLVLALLAHFIFVAQTKALIGPESLFILMGVGTFAATLNAAAQKTGSFAHPYCDFIGLGLIVFILGTLASRSLLRFRHLETLQDFRARPWINDLQGLQLYTILAIGVVSLAVSFTYYYLLGFFVPHAALRTLFATGAEDMTVVYNELRQSSSAVGRYLGPGYVYQFKNCLLPLATILLYFKTRVDPQRIYRFVFGFLLASTVISTIGTGERFALAFFVTTFLIIGISNVMAPFRFTFTQVFATGAVALLLLSALTLMMGARGQEIKTDLPLLWAPYQVLDRVFNSPSRERFEVYLLFLEGKEPRWGLNAIDELKTVLPGRQSHSLSNQLHNLLYGSPYGNVSLDVWGSLWYDFHWFGLLALFLLGMGYNAFYILMLRGPKSLIRIVTLNYAGLVLGIATDLQVLLLWGFLTCLIFLSIVKLARLLQPAFLPRKALVSQRHSV